MADNYADFKAEAPDFVKSEEDFDLYRMRHTTEHVFNQAVEELWPGKVLRAMGPAISDGWYNDSRWDVKLTEEDFPKIEAKMQEIIDADLPLVREDISEEEAREMFKDNPFKLEFIDEFVAAGNSLSVYKTGDQFTDLCKGPHLESTGKVKAFKLLSIAGAYWRGDENNEMLVRVYGTTFNTPEELERYLIMKEEAKARDHRKLGKELGLFVFSDLVGKGLPLWTEKGATVRRELERYVVDEEIKRGYRHVYTPDIANLDLYRTSGHYPYYKDSMYAPITIDDEEFMLRPMTCPHHFELYKSEPRSYRELPMRIAELAKLYRYEKSGELSGLIRVRGFCLADAHVIVTPDQVESEIHRALDLIEDMAQVFGLEKNVDFWYRLSLGNRANEEKYYKDDAAWEQGETILRNILENRDTRFVEAEDEAAFYGPKIDIQMRNVNGKEDTAFTVQYDFVMPKRFELAYIDSDGSEKEPLVIHRSSIGAIERIVAFLIERYAGAFPAWLAPVQVGLIPISEDNFGYAGKLADELRAAGVRVEIDDANDRMGNKIRKAQEQKVPYMLIMGKQEEEKGTVSVRLRSGEEYKDMDFQEFKEGLLQNIAEKKLEIALK